MSQLDPIPSELLIHTIKYSEYVEEGSFGAVWKEEEEITDVLFQSKTELRIDANSKDFEISGIIFLDSVNTPKFKPLKVDSKIKFNDLDMVVKECLPLYDYDPDVPHHYEVKVI